MTPVFMTKINNSLCPSVMRSPDQRSKHAAQRDGGGIWNSDRFLPLELECVKSMRGEVV